MRQLLDSAHPCVFMVQIWNVGLGRWDLFTMNKWSCVDV
jgi:hypothetical protein